MRILRFALILLLSVATASGLRAGPEDESDADDIPVVGRPKDVPFSGASGQFDEPSARAEPTTLEAETPLTLTLRIHATGPVRRPPGRLDLTQLPEITKRFYVEDPEDGSRHPDASTWEFVYRLKPKRTDVTEIPGLPFSYFNPTLMPASSAFQVLYTEPIQLHVRPHEVVPVPLQAPAAAFELATGPALLARRKPWSPPGPATVIALLLLPPLLCAGWFAAWRHFYPDAARQARQRRSRAARLALQQLRGAARLSSEERAARSAAAVAGYLRERLELTVAEPTPAEAAAHLNAKGCSAALAEQAAHLFECWDAARFLPAPWRNGQDLTAAAEEFILAVEAETCPAAQS